MPHYFLRNLSLTIWSLRKWAREREIAGKGSSSAFLTQFHIFFPLILWGCNNKSSLWGISHSFLLAQKKNPWEVMKEREMSWKVLDGSNKIRENASSKSFSHHTVSKSSNKFLERWTEKIKIRARMDRKNCKSLFYCLNLILCRYVLHTDMCYNYLWYITPVYYCTISIVQQFF